MFSTLFYGGLLVKSMFRGMVGIYNWTVLNLFGSGFVGASFDPSDLSTLFQDVDGLFPVTAPGQAVARMNDKSGNGFHATQATLAMRPIFAQEPKVGRRNMLPNSGSSGAVVGVVGAGGALPTGWGLSTALTREVIAIGETDGIPWFDLRLTGTFTGPYFINLSTSFTVPAADGQTWNASIYAQAIGSVVGADALVLRPASRIAGGSPKFDYPAVTIDFPVAFTRFTSPAATLSNADGAAGNVAFVIGYLLLTCNGTVDLTLRLGGRQLERSSTTTTFQTVNGPFNVTEAGVPTVYYLSSDQVDDSLPATLPSLGTTATVWNSLGIGINSSPVQTVGAGAFETLRGAKTYAVGAINRGLEQIENHTLMTQLEDQRAVNPTGFTSLHPLLVSRATTAWAQGLSGNLYAFGPNQRRLTSAGLTLMGAATRLHGEAPTNGATSGAPTLTTLPVEGLFTPMRVASNGADSAARVTQTFSVNNAVPIYLRVRLKEGTSARTRIIVQNNTASTVSVVRGEFAAPSVVNESAGTITSLVNRLLPGGEREFTFTFTPNSASSSVNLVAGPDSATSGETIDIIGMQATSQFSEWIMGGTGTVAVAADITTLDLTGVDLSEGFMLRLDGTVLATPRILSDRFYQADTGTNNTRALTFIVSVSGTISIEQFSAGAGQGGINLNGALSPPSVFSLVGAHGVNYTGGAWNGVVATPDNIAEYVVPTTLRIGSALGAVNNLPLTLTHLTLFPETPTTARVTAVSAT